MNFKQFLAEMPRRRLRWRNYPTAGDTAERLVNDYACDEIADKLGLARLNVILDGTSSFYGDLARISLSIRLGKRTDSDLLLDLLPIVVKNVLESKKFDVSITAVEVIEAVSKLGRESRKIRLAATLKYPQEWIDYDKQRYNYT